MLGARDLPEELLGGGDRTIVSTGVVIVFLLGVTFQGLKYQASILIYIMMLDT